ncbi:hypothetical protein OROGR_025795 [Orobanche gracilis]
MEVIRRPLERYSLVVLFFAVLTVGAFICTRYIDSSASELNCAIRLDSSRNGSI